MFFYSELLGRRAGIEFSEDYKKKLKKMFEASMYCMKPNGMIPQIGDNDSGRFLQFSKRIVLDHSYLLSLAALYFKDNSFKLRQFKLDEEAFWLFGEKAVTAWESLDFREGYLKSRSFPDAGWYVMRHENNYCFVSCGPNGGDGWHSHNDKLSFELVIDGHDVIVDPGTYVYTSFPETRNKYRSTEYHNTIKFDGYEQNGIPEKIMFSLPDKVKILRSELKENDDMISFHGEISYRNITHKRTISLDNTTYDWQITDNFSCPYPVNAKLLFHLSPEITIERNAFLVKKTLEKIASIEVGGYEFKNDNYGYSPEYGVRIDSAESLAAFISLSGSNQKTITTISRKRANIF
jgi:hypothetical protein